MKIQTLIITLASAALLAACGHTDKAPQLDSHNDTLSWAMGENIGLSLIEMNGVMPLNQELVQQALRHTLKGGAQPIDDNTLRGCRIWAESQPGVGTTMHCLLALYTQS